MKNILITGGAGFIGSHTCLVFLEKGYNLYVLDSFVNSTKSVFEGIKKILKLSKKLDKKKLNIFEGDIRDKKFLQNIFKEASKKDQKIDGVLHFAGLKAVGESTEIPLKYWDVNVNGTINLLQVMDENDCKTILFSSSATVYGDKNKVPFEESYLKFPVNPYGLTKATVEDILQNLFESKDSKWKISNLRYFNPIGAHPSGLIGEMPFGEPQNLFPILCQVAKGVREKLFIYGNDWPTPDGTCYRDYIHVMDLAEVHFLSMEYILKLENCNLILNVGTGKSNSVLELINAFEKVNNIKINREFIKRRKGDIANSYASTKKISRILNWKPSKNIYDMCKDGWRWQKNL